MERSGRAYTATMPTRPNPVTTTSPGHGVRREASPATAAASTMTTAMPESSTSLSYVPKVRTAKSLSCTGVRSIAPLPTAR